MNPDQVHPPGDRYLYVGHDGEKVVDSSTTLSQIAVVRALACRLLHATGEPVTWDEVDDPNDHRTLLQYIVGDRKVRVDANRLMADRPPIAVVTAAGGDAVRLEYYEGHDALEKTHDLRAAELRAKDLPDFLVVDPHAYDPIAFLAEVFGYHEDFTRPLIEEIHKPRRPMEKGSFVWLADLGRVGFFTPEPWGVSVHVGSNEDDLRSFPRGIGCGEWSRIEENNQGFLRITR